MEDKDLIKHNAAIHISNDVALLQRKIWNILLVNSYDDLPDKEIFHINVKDLMRVLNLQSSNNREHIKKSVESLAKYTIRWNVLGKAEEDEDWGFMYFLAEARIKKGVLSYAYPPTLRKLLHNPSWFSRIKLSMQNKFSSKYGLALFELCASAYIRKRGQGTTGWIEIGIFRELMGLGGKESKYTDFKDLNKFVIKPALKEVNEAEDFKVTVQFRRDKKFVIAIKFDIKEGEFKDKGLRSGEQPRLADVYDRDLFLEMQEKFGLSKSDALNVMSRHDADYIKGNLEVVRKKHEAGKITDNLAAYTIKAMSVDFRPKESALVRKDEEIKEREETEAINKEIVVKLEQEYNKTAKAEAAKILRSLSKEDKQKYVAMFEEELSTLYPAMFGMYQRRGLESPVFRSQFESFLVLKLGPADFRNLAAFAAARNIKLKKNGRGEYEVAGDAEA